MATKDLKTMPGTVTVKFRNLSICF